MMPHKEVVNINKIQIFSRENGPFYNSLNAATNLVILAVAAQLINSLIRNQTNFFNQNPNIPLRWRSNQNRNDERERLIRHDTRHPSVIFEQGFNVRSQDYSVTDFDWDIFTYVNGSYTSIHSPFVSTTRTVLYDDGIWNEWVPYPGDTRMDVGDIVYVYEIFAPGGIDINLTFGSDTPVSEHNEIAFPGGIRREFIRSAIALKVIKKENEDDSDSSDSSDSGDTSLGFLAVAYHLNSRFIHNPELNLPVQRIPHTVPTYLWEPQ